MIQRKVSIALLTILLPLCGCTQLKRTGGGGVQVGPTLAPTATPTDMPYYTATPTATPTPTTVSVTLPPAPTNFSTTAATSSALTLHWTPAGGSTTGYRLAVKAGSIYPTNCNVGDFVVNISGGFTSSVTLSGLLSSTQYAFRLCSVGGSPAGSLSASLMGLGSTTAPPGTVPTATYTPTATSTPTGTLSPTPTRTPVGAGPEASGFHIELTDHRQLYLGWTQAPSPARAYRLAGAVGATAPADCFSGAQFYIPSVTQTTLQVYDLDPVTQYSFRLCTVSSGTNPIVSPGVTVTGTTNGWRAISNDYRPAARKSHTAVWTGSKMIIWGGTTATTKLLTGSTYDLAADHWSAITTANAPTARVAHTAVWSGSRMIVWGGLGTSGTVRTGAQYDPANFTWTTMTTTNSPVCRQGHTAVWTGGMMIVWGGRSDNTSSPATMLRDGGLFNGSTWAPLSLTGGTSAPTARTGHTAVWTGSKMLIWGGLTAAGAVRDGKLYDPATNTWSDISSTNAPAARYGHTAVWTGTKMVIWGGSNPSGLVDGGGVYDLATNSWTAMTFAAQPDLRSGHTAVYGGGSMIVFGGLIGSSSVDSGGKYTPASTGVSEQWLATSFFDVPLPRDSHTAVWTGSRMIIWGGVDRGPGTAAYLDDGAVFVP